MSAAVLPLPEIAPPLQAPGGKSYRPLESSRSYRAIQTSAPAWTEPRSSGVLNPAARRLER